MFCILDDWEMEVPFNEKDGRGKPKKQMVTFSVWDFAGQGKPIHFMFRAHITCTMM
jgi:hypothetical protein